MSILAQNPAPSLVPPLNGSKVRFQLPTHQPSSWKTGQHTSPSMASTLHHVSSQTQIPFHQTPSSLPPSNNFKSYSNIPSATPAAMSGNMKSNRKKKSKNKNQHSVQFQPIAGYMPSNAYLQVPDHTLFHSSSFTSASSSSSSSSSNPNRHPTTLLPSEVPFIPPVGESLTTNTFAGFTAGYLQDHSHTYPSYYRAAQVYDPPAPYNPISAKFDAVYSPNNKPVDLTLHRTKSLPANSVVHRVRPDPGLPYLLQLVTLQKPNTSGLSNEFLFLRAYNAYAISKSGLRLGLEMKDGVCLLVYEQNYNPSTDKDYAGVRTLGTIRDIERFRKIAEGVGVPLKAKKDNKKNGEEVGKVSYELQFEGFRAWSSMIVLRCKERRVLHEL